MAGNSKRRGPVSKGANPKGAKGAAPKGGKGAAPKGGGRPRGLQGKGPTPRAEDRPHHKAYRNPKPTRRKPARAPADEAEWVAGRNAVLELVRAGAPVTSLYIAEGSERDDRLREVFRVAAEQHLGVLEVTRLELDRMTSGAAHQGIAARVPAYDYADPEELSQHAAKRGEDPLVVLLDGVTDPRNLGAVVRSAAGFGAHGVVVPQRRAAGMTATAWKASAGAAARVPVARTVNPTRQLKTYQQAGLMVVGLAADGEVELPDLDLAEGPLVLVVGGEGGGLSRLVAQTCDVRTAIPTGASLESLNASVAAGIALYAIAQRRGGPPPR